MMHTGVLALLAVGAFAMPQSLNDIEWIKFKYNFKKVYEPKEEIMRRDIFMSNLDLIEKHNAEFRAGQQTYRLGVNEYADMTLKEFTNQMNGLRPELKQQSDNTFLSSIYVTDLPTTVDWRDKGYVTPVKNQGQCGSCWAFSATGSLEGQHFKKTGKLVSLSEQNLVDCSWNFGLYLFTYEDDYIQGLIKGNQGCQGGLPDNSFRYVRSNDGIDTETSYPYQAKDLSCRFKRADVGATDTGYVDVTKGSEFALKQAVATIGPVSVGIDANHRSFHLYKDGIYNEPNCSSTQLDHGVLAVGYGVGTTSDYWLVKNSWGTSWGMKGYIKMSRNLGNQCGIATLASYPLMQ